PGILAKPTLERLAITGDDGADCRFEGGYWRRRLGQRLEMRGKDRPADEPMRARDHELGIRQRAFRMIAPAREPCSCELLDIGGAPLDFVRVPETVRFVQMCREGVQPRDGPCSNGVVSARGARLDQVLGELSVLIEIRP